MPGLSIRLPAGLLRFSLLATLLLASCAVGLIAPRPGASHEPVTTKVTFNKEIVRIFQRHCLACHDSSNITNIPLRTFAQARPWAKAFKEEVLERRMPPSQAVKGFGQFQHDYTLTQREIDLIVSWVEGGAPKGDEKDLPPSIAPGDWPLGKPDLVLEPEPELNISSATGYETRCLTLPTNLNRDVSVTAMDFHAGDDVQGASFWIASGQTSAAVAGCGTTGAAPLGSWIPGQPVARWPEGTGRRLPAHALISMQIRYRRGPQLNDRSALGLYLTEARSTRPLRTITLTTSLTEIPAGAASQRLKASYEVPEAWQAISVRPLLFPFAKSLEVTAHRPDGTDEVLVWAKDYRYDWQPDYVFARPLALPRGTRIEVTAYLDNSDDNPNNPNQPARPLRMAMPLCELSIVNRGPNPLLTKTGYKIQHSDFVSALAADSYVCPMHPDVIADQPGQCPRCGMTMRRTRPPETAEYDLRLTTAPAMVRPGEKFKLNLLIEHPKTGARVRKFHVVHDRPYHLFVVSEDLRYFAHIHPQQKPDGRFTIETTVPRAGAYVVYSDFFPDGGWPQVIYRNLITSGFTGDLFSRQARLEPDAVLSKTQDGVRFDLTLDPAEVLGGKPATLKYHLTDDVTGEPVKDLQPYLGAWGHTLIISEDARSYVHSHPQVMIPDDADRSRMLGSADQAFEVFFPQPGIYRVWSQFQRRGQVITVSFAIKVRR